MPASREGPMRTMALLFVCSAALAAEERHIYRLDFVVTENEGGKPASSTTCTLNLEEKRAGEIKMGSNIPLPNKGARVDVGLKLSASFTSVGEDLLVDGDIEITAAKDAQSFRKMSAKGNALVSPGKP